MLKNNKFMIFMPFILVLMFGFLTIISFNYSNDLTNNVALNDITLSLNNTNNFNVYKVSNENKLTSKDECDSSNVFSKIKCSFQLFLDKIGEALWRILRVIFYII